MTLEYQIGVDAGGTHTTAIAYDLTGNEMKLARVKSIQITTLQSRTSLVPLTT